MKSQRKNAVIIAIVDDDESVREALAGVLKTAGFAVRTYTSAEEFLESYDGQNIDCALLDITASRNERCGTSTPDDRIRQSGTDCLHYGTRRRKPAQRFDECWCKGFLEKPVRRETLLAEIGAAISKIAEG